MMAFAGVLLYIFCKYYEPKEGDNVKSAMKLKRGAYWIGLVAPLAGFFSVGLYCLISVGLYIMLAYVVEHWLGKIRKE